jgi:hypothetical protein
MLSVVQPGYEYELPCLDEPDTIVPLIFVRYEGEQMINIGTTNEMVLRVLIDRIKFQQAKFPCEENVNALDCVRMGLFFIELRAQTRKLQGLVRKPQQHETNYDIEIPHLDGIEDLPVGDDHHILPEAWNRFVNR